ncbi:hypothetical protein GCM10027564_26000 [Luteimonas notoginsengisoli]
MDAKPAGGFQLGLVEIADAAFDHQLRGFVGEAVPAFARARFGVLTGAVHVASQPEIRLDFTGCRVEVDPPPAPHGPRPGRTASRSRGLGDRARARQKMSNASSSSVSSLL